MKNIIFGTFALLTSPGSFAEVVQDTKTISIEVTEKGFVPGSLNVTSGTDVTLEVTRKTDATCSTEIQVPSAKIRKPLPLNQKVSIALGKLEKGEIRFGCGMEMMEGGKIVVR